MNRVAEFASQARKFLAALAALVGVLIANGLLDGSAAKWVTGVIAALGAFLVFYVPNDADTPGKHVAE